MLQSSGEMTGTPVLTSSPAVRGGASSQPEVRCRSHVALQAVGLLPVLGRRGPHRSTGWTGGHTVLSSGHRQPRRTWPRGGSRGLPPVSGAARPASQETLAEPEQQVRACMRFQPVRSQHLRRCMAAGRCEREHSPPRSLLSDTLFPGDRNLYRDDRAEMVSFCVFTFTLLSCFLNLSWSSEWRGSGVWLRLLLVSLHPTWGRVGRGPSVPRVGLADRLPGGHPVTPGIKPARPVVVPEWGQTPLTGRQGCLTLDLGTLTGSDVGIISRLRGACAVRLVHLGSAHSDRGSSRKVVPPLAGGSNGYLSYLTFFFCGGPETL